MIEINQAKLFAISEALQQGGSGSGVCHRRITSEDELALILPAGSSCPFALYLYCTVDGGSDYVEHHLCLPLHLFNRMKKSRLPKNEWWRKN